MYCIRYKTIIDKNDKFKDIKVINVDLFDEYKEIFPNDVEFKNNIKMIDMDLSDDIKPSISDIKPIASYIKSNASDIALSDEESESDIALSDEESESDIESNASDIALSDEESESDTELEGGHLPKLKGKKIHSPKPFQSKNLINNTKKVYRLKPLQNKGMQYNSTKVNKQKFFENKTLQNNKVSKFSKIINQKSKIVYITKDTPLFNFDNHANNMGFIYDLSCEKRGTTFNDDMNLYMKIYKQICKSAAFDSNNEKICIN